MFITNVVYFIFVVSLTSELEYWDPGDADGALNTYFTNDYIETKLKELERKYPKLLYTDLMGLTPKRNKINYAVITENARLWRMYNRPSIKLVANMHGNEVRGRGLLMKFIVFLLEKFNYEDEVKDLVKNTIFYIVPTVNPDGFDSARRGQCSGTMGRYTSVGVDLNRDFPDHRTSGVKLKFADETKLIMNFTSYNPSVLSLSFHDGALVVNYPWDAHPTLYTGKYAASPDDKLFVHLAKNYAKNHKSMSDMSKQCGSDKFQNGITNGNSWYQVFNGMQDWNYYNMESMELTVELGCCKYPSDSKKTFTDVWSDNFKSLMEFSKAARKGIYGSVKNMSGRALQGAVIDIGSAGQKITVKHMMGWYWRPLMPGTYDITASKPGYYSLTKRKVVVEREDSYVEVNFILLPKSQVRLLGKRRLQKAHKL